jgi:hypothetical protein
VIRGPKKEEDHVTLVGIVSAIFAFGAAALWGISAAIPIPRYFPILVTSVSTKGEEVTGAKVISSGSSAELDELGMAIIRQSRLSAWGAVSAGIAVLLQAILFFWLAV